MNMSDHGIDAEMVNGVLEIKTSQPLRIKLNGRMLNGVTGCSAEPVVPKQTFWQPDGSQSDTTIDLRGGPL